MRRRESGSGAGMGAGGVATIAPERPVGNGTRGRTAPRLLPGPPVLPERATWGCLPGPAGRGRPCSGQKWAELGRGSEATRTQGAGQESCAGVTGAAPLVAERVRVAWKEQARVRPVTATEDGLAGGSGNLRGGPSKGVNTPQPAGLQQLPAHTAPGHTETDGQLVDRQDVRT